MSRCEHCIHLYVCVRHFWSEIYSGDNAERDFLKMDNGKWCDLFQENFPRVPIAFASCPHYRCPDCKSAVVMLEGDEKPDSCPYCGRKLDWDKVGEEYDDE